MLPPRETSAAAEPSSGWDEDFDLAEQLSGQAMDDSRSNSAREARQSGSEDDWGDDNGSHSRSSSISRGEAGTREDCCKPVPSRSRLVKERPVQRLNRRPRRDGQQWLAGAVGGAEGAGQ